MRIVGIVCIIIGVLMMMFNGVNYKTEKNLVDIGPVKINKEENKHVGWPSYAGGIIALAGLGIIFIPNKSK